MVLIKTARRSDLIANPEPVPKQTISYRKGERLKQARHLTEDRELLGDANPALNVYTYIVLSELDLWIKGELSHVGDLQPSIEVD